MSKTEKQGMECWIVEGGFIWIRTPKSRIYAYHFDFMNWVLCPPLDDNSGYMKFRTEEELLDYLLTQ